MTPEALFEASVKLIQSESIRAWAQSAHNRPLWVEYCATATKRDPLLISTYMTCLAMGL